MEAVNRFFRKYLLTSAATLILFFVLNIVLIFSVLIWAWQSSSKPDIHLRQISESITVNENGTLIVDAAIADTLNSQNAWAMILNDDGQVLWQECMPDSLPREYSATDIAKFSRWYLQDYPVYVLEHPAGLLVVGCEPDSLVKYNFTLDINYILTIVLGIGIVILANILLVIFLFWRNTRKVEKAVVPILDGIETISQGKPINLPEKGELAEINVKLNRTGKYIIQKDLARADWISGISHDVRTPLSIMLGYAGEMEDNTLLPPEIRTQAGIIRKQGEKLRHLTADLNLTSKLEYAMQPLNIEKVYPLELAREIISGYLNNGLDERYSFDLQAGSEVNTMYIHGDLALLSRMIDNLIKNCIIHNPNGCDITVGVKKDENFCVVSVIDDGIGVPEEKLKDFNNGSFSESVSKSDNEVAHGMGLRLVYQIAKAHNGTVLFENVLPHGLSAVIHIPIG